MTLDLPNIIGLIGSAMMVVAYAYSNMAKSLDLVFFNLLNLVGAVFLITSLWYHFNLASFSLEVVWLLIASIGLAKAWARRGQA